MTKKISTIYSKNKRGVAVRYLRCCRNHVFINIDGISIARLYDCINFNRVYPDHKFHLYLCDGLNGENLKFLNTLVLEANNHSLYPIYIHIPKSCKYLVSDVEKGIDKDSRYRIMLEKDSTMTIYTFSSDNGYTTYFCLSHIRAFNTFTYEFTKRKTSTSRFITINDILPKGATYAKCGKSHVFIDQDFSEIVAGKDYYINMIAKCHKVHIFISNDYSEDGYKSLEEFLNMIKNHTTYPVYFHLAYGDIKNKLKDYIPKRFKHKIFVSRGPVAFFYAENLKNNIMNSYMIISFNHELKFYEDRYIEIKDVQDIYDVLWRNYND